MLTAAKKDDARPPNASGKAPKKTRKPLCSTSSAQDDLSSSSSTESSSNIFCLRPSPMNTEFERNDVLSVFEKLEKASAQPRWIEESECLDVDDGCDDFFIVPSFHGPVFEHLRSMGVRIFGSHIMHDCLGNGSMLPRRNRPTYSLTLQDSRVCFTGVAPAEKRKHLSELVCYMGGIVSRELRPNVTHLVTERADLTSAKYKECTRLGIPVVTCDWIEAAWQHALDGGSDDFTVKDATSKYLVSLFQGSVFSVSGIIGQERQDLCQLVEVNGGKILGDMGRNTCTHLITDKPKGEKYNRAMSWKIVTIVTSRWVRKCVEKNRLLDPSLFHPNRPVSSTQHAQGIAPGQLDCSSIDGPGFGGNYVDTPVALSQRTNQSAGVALSTRSIVQQTMADTPESSATSKRKTILRESSRRNLLNPPVPIYKDPIDQLDASLLKGDFDFLEGCLIWLCGVDEIGADKWRRAIDRSGATRVQNATSATHVIVLRAVGSDLQQVLAAQRGHTQVVRGEWILECYRQKDQVSSDEYLWTPQTAARAERIPSQRRSSPEPFINMKSHEPATNVSVVNNQGITNEEPRDQLAHSYNEQQIQSRLNTFHGLSESTTHVKIFENITFRMFNTLSEAAIEFMEYELPRNGGVIVKDNDVIVDYLICDVVDYGRLGASSNLCCRHVASEFYVRRCVEDSMFHDVNKHPLYKPIDAVEDDQPFADTLAFIANLRGFEKCVITSLLTKFGAQLHENIRVKASATERATTHLISGRDSSSESFQRAKKIKNLRIVDPSWIIESILHSEQQDESLFPVGEFPYCSYGRRDDLWKREDWCSIHHQQSGVCESVATENDVCEGALENEEDFEQSDGNQFASERTDSPVADVFSDVEDEPYLSSDGTSEVPTDISSHGSLRGDMMRGFVRQRDSFDPSKPFKPQLMLDGVSQVIDGLDSPGIDSQDSSILSTTAVGAVLSKAAERMARPSITAFGRRMSEKDVACKNAELSKTPRTYAATQVITSEKVEQTEFFKQRMNINDKITNLRLSTGRGSRGVSKKVVAAIEVAETSGSRKRCLVPDATATQLVKRIPHDEARVHSDRGEIYHKLDLSASHSTESVSDPIPETPLISKTKIKSAQENLSGPRRYPHKKL